MAIRGGSFTPTRGTLAGVTFRSYRQYRNALARRHGFPSLYAQQRSAKVIRSRADYGRLSEAQRAARDRALDALALMRREGKSLARASREAYTTRAAIRRYAGSELKRERGRYVAKEADRLYRRMYMLDENGRFEIDVYSSRAASAIGEYWAALQQYTSKGDDRALKSFQRRMIRTGKKTYRFLTDTRIIDRLASFGELSFESIYAS